MTTRTLRGAVCLLAAGLAVTVSASPALADDCHAKVQQILDQTVTDDGLPGILSDIRDGREPWFGTAGAGDTETGRERRRQDRFRIGSATKTFTSTVMLKLAAEGRLSLDDTVEKWLPGEVRGNGNDGTKITIRNLLNQTSGLFPYTSDESVVPKYFTPAFLDHRFDTMRPEEMVKLAVAHPPMFAPGTAWAYSNSNYALAGIIIEKATGRSYAEEVEQRITRPLGLTATYVPGFRETKLRGPHGRAYSTLWVTEPGADVYDVTDMNASWAWAAGGMVSTAGDLQNFYRALLGGRLLPPSQQKEMFTTVSTEGSGWPVPNARYGLGVFSQTLSCGVTAWGGGGMIHGSWTNAMGTADGRHTVVTNINGDWGNPIGIFTKVLEAELCPPRSR
ncbi:serine hydrolase domain-containing protein [Amycolatopsis sp. lyj-112]|uniref:serine hydrolase domain-containing protein n=1 Tax=Amycolatopsis sp. lyj-112 TaxID=2789288 RepID=UPI00397D43B2